MREVFVSYRRADSSDITGRIFDHLKTKFGAERLFKDVESIPLGKDFRNEISSSVGQCAVLIAVIGDDWLSIADEKNRRRIDDPNDYVHLEIAAALKRGIPVIPVLVQGAQMPRPSDLPEAIRALAFRNATSVRTDPDFKPDIDRLCGQLTEYVDKKQKRWSVSRLLRTTALIASLLLILATVLVCLRPSQLTKEEQDKIRILGNSWLEAVLKRDVDRLANLSDITSFLFEGELIDNETVFRERFKQITADRLNSIDASSRKALVIGRLKGLKSEVPKQWRAEDNVNDDDVIAIVEYVTKDRGSERTILLFRGAGANLKVRGFWN